MIDAEEPLTPGSDSEVKGCPPLCVTEVSLRTVDYYLEGEREEAAVTVARATFDELLRAGYEPAA